MKLFKNIIADKSDRRMRYASILLAVFLLSPMAFTDTIHIPGDQPTIQAGINAAVNGDTVLVSPGTYVENINFLGKAITVESSNGAETTVIDGGIPINPDEGSVVLFNSGEGADSILDGFTITNGIALRFYGIYYGGGIFCYESSPTVTNNIIVSNSSLDYGGGFCCYWNAFPTLTNNVISNNSAPNGAGICCIYDSSLTITDSIIDDNTDGDGILCIYYSTLNLSDSKITGNSDAGVRCYAEAPATINNCFIAENSRSGINCSNNTYTDITITITNNAIIDNTALEDGGGIRCSNQVDATITNNLISGNSTTHGDGGGIHIDMGADATLCGNTITGNRADQRGGGICLYIGFVQTVQIIDTVLWDNEAPIGTEIYSDYNTLDISYSNVQGGQDSIKLSSSATLLWGSGMIDADPCFTAGVNGCYYLSQPDSGQALLSPCVDAGSDLASNLGMGTYWTRTDGVPDSGVVDIGFHYGPFSSSWTAPLYSDIYTLPELTGGAVSLSLDAGADNQSRPYLILAGTSGTSPGFPLPGGVTKVPVNWDWFTDIEMGLLNTTYFQNFLGTLDANGLGSANFNFPGHTGTAGLVFYFAYCLGYPYEFASNPVEIHVVP